jgi:hypothetical protein
MGQAEPWPELLALVEPYYLKAGNGRLPVGLAIMLRSYFPRQWFNFSDPRGYWLRVAAAPDETPIPRFRRLQDDCQRREYIKCTTKRWPIFCDGGHILCDYVALESKQL